jgi:hypothetical protein
MKKDNSYGECLVETIDMQTRFKSTYEWRLRDSPVSEMHNIQNCSIDSLCGGDRFRQSIEYSDRMVGQRETDDTHKFEHSKCLLETCTKRPRDTVGLLQDSYIDLNDTKLLDLETTEDVDPCDSKWQHDRKEKRCLSFSSPFDDNSTVTNGCVNKSCTSPISSPSNNKTRPVRFCPIKGDERFPLYDSANVIETNHGMVKPLVSAVSAPVVTVCVGPGGFVFCFLITACHTLSPTHA